MVAFRDVHSPQERSTAELIKEAFDESQELIKAEVALARHEARREVAALKRFVIAMGIASLAAILGLVLLLLAGVLALMPASVMAAVVFGCLLMAVALTAGLLGLLALPARPMPQTQENLKADLQLLEDQFADQLA